MIRIIITAIIGLFIGTTAWATYSMFFSPIEHHGLIQYKTPNYTTTTNTILPTVSTVPIAPKTTQPTVKLPTTKVTDYDYINAATKAEREGRVSEALQNLVELQNRFPESQYTPLAKRLILIWQRKHKVD